MATHIQVSSLHLFSFNSLTPNFFTSNTTLQTTITHCRFFCSYRNIFRETDIYRILHLIVGVDTNLNVGQMLGHASPLTTILIQMPMQQLMPMLMFRSIPSYPRFGAPYGYKSVVTQTSPT